MLDKFLHHKPCHLYVALYRSTELIDEFLLENSTKERLPGPPPPPADSDDQLHIPTVMTGRSSSPVLVSRCTASKVSNNIVLYLKILRFCSVNQGCYAISLQSKSRGGLWYLFFKCSHQNKNHCINCQSYLVYYWVLIIIVLFDWSFWFSPNLVQKWIGLKNNVKSFMNRRLYCFNA